MHLPCEHSPSEFIFALRTSQELCKYSIPSNPDTDRRPRSSQLKKAFDNEEEMEDDQDHDFQLDCNVADIKNRSQTCVLDQGGSEVNNNHSNQDRNEDSPSGSHTQTGRKTNLHYRGQRTADSRDDREIGEPSRMTANFKQDSRAESVGGATSPAQNDYPNRTESVLTQCLKEINIQLWDAPSREEFQSLVKIYYRNVRGVIMTVSLEHAPETSQIQKQLKALDYCIDEMNKTLDISKLVSFVLMGTKCDAPFQPDKANDQNVNKVFADCDRKIKDWMEHQSTKHSINIRYFQVSAKKAVGVTEATTQLAVLMDKQSQQLDIDGFTYKRRPDSIRLSTRDHLRLSNAEVADYWKDSLMTEDQKSSYLTGSSRQAKKPVKEQKGCKC